MMRYVIFSLGFILIHTISYILAGAIDLKLTPDLYEGKDRLLDFLRDMSDEEESENVQKFFIPAQILRGLLMSIVFYPILGPLSDLSFIIRTAFFVCLVYIFTDLASADPFAHNIEGWVYMKKKYLTKTAFWKLHLEMIIYSLIFGISVSLLLF